MPVWKSASTAGRPKPGQQSSIRGRISGPIPIPNPGDDDEFPIRTPGSGIAIPANDDENFEFPIRKPGAGIATTYPLPEDTPEGQDTPAQRQHTQELQPPPPQAGTAAVSVSGSNTDTSQNSNADPEPPSHAAPGPPSDSRSSSGHRATKTPPRVSPPQRRSPPSQTIAPASALRYSTVSEAPTSQSRDGASPKRKKSTLRTALGRLFGRKKKSRDSQGLTPSSRRTSAIVSSTQHRSDPSALNRGKDGEPKRSASLPITEYDRALRSHSIGPDTITAIESARNSLQATNSELGPSPSRKRAATTGGRLFPPHHASSLRAGRVSVEGGWAGGLSPRPASTHGRGSRVIPGELEDPSEIGRAITSDSGGGNRRRSRSLSGLNDIFAAGQGGRASVGQDVRRRSDEIKYWRESYNVGFRSPLSSNAPADAETDKEQDQDRDDTKSGVIDESAPQSPVDNEQQAQDLPPRTPPRPFNFESITRDMVGMKITQAASMDTRIGGLESRMARLERVVDQLCHAVPGFKTPLTETPVPGPTTYPSATSDPSSFSYAYTTAAAPPMIPAIYQTMSSDLGISHNNSPGSRQSTADDDDSMHQSSHFSFGEAQTYIGSLHPPSSSATGTQSLTPTAPASTQPPPFHASNRPTSTATVRGATSLPTLGLRDASDLSDTADDYTTSALLSQVETERAARQDLEAQVAKLSQRLNTLSQTMYAMVRSPDNSSGLAKARSTEHLLPQPPTPKQSPAQVKSVPSGPPQKPATLSAFDAEDDDDKPADDEDERQTEEEFLTPGEERSTLGGGYGFGAFGEPLRDDDETEADEDERHETEDDSKRRKAARTLSLSQLTLGKKGGRAVQI
ncbi:hypothetical protein CONLIGDRAFT_675999 [Coniochaeta ligniaria NRRL 30616]|uniref:Uncharacterized protein n=1 Tax=Coniochaeta ligniaria NRRL 30616 TaxID=1408157 RepID=A0A1J7JNT3_9PEZI|nr:hypothetical protein CONLIGDRAFT_675999 [Coniochaeta ligniaria NRRL 30616]